jgi:hypothetical protein
MCRLFDAARQERDKKEIASWLCTQIYADLQDTTGMSSTCTLSLVLDEVDLLSDKELLSGDDVAFLVQTALLNR